MRRKRRQRQRIPKNIQPIRSVEPRHNVNIPLNSGRNPSPPQISERPIPSLWLANNDSSNLNRPIPLFDPNNQINSFGNPYVCDKSLQSPVNALYAPPFEAVGQFPTTYDDNRNIGNNVPGLLDMNIVDQNFTNNFEGGSSDQFFNRFQENRKQPLLRDFPSGIGNASNECFMHDVQQTMHSSSPYRDFSQDRTAFEKSKSFQNLQSLSNLPQFGNNLERERMHLQGVEDARKKLNTNLTNPERSLNNLPVSFGKGRVNPTNKRRRYRPHKGHIISNKNLKNKNKKSFNRSSNTGSGGDLHISDREYNRGGYPKEENFSSGEYFRNQECKNNYDRKEIPPLSLGNYNAHGFSAEGSEKKSYNDMFNSHHLEREPQIPRLLDFQNQFGRHQGKDEVWSDHQQNNNVLSSERENRSINDFAIQQFPSRPMLGTNEYESNHFDSWPKRDSFEKLPLSVWEKQRPDQFNIDSSMKRIENERHLFNDFETNHNFDGYNSNVFEKDDLKWKERKFENEFSDTDDEDLRIHLLRLKQQKIEEQLEELEKKSKETDRKLSLLENRSPYF